MKSQFHRRYGEGVAHQVHGYDVTALLKLLDIFRVADLFGGCLFWVMTVGGPEATDLGTPSATHARGQT